MLELFASTFNFIANFFAGIGVVNSILGALGIVGAAIVAVILSVGRVAKAISSIMDLVAKLGFSKGKPINTGGDNEERLIENVSDAAVQLELIKALREGKLTFEQILALGFNRAAQEFENAPPPKAELPTGSDPADEYVREFVRLATSKNDKEREAIALDLEGKTEEALVLLAELAEEEVQLACARWKSRGAMAYNQFTAKAIESYERAVGCSPDDAEAHNQLGHLFRRTGDLARARTAYEKVLSLGNVSADQELIAVAYGNLGLIERRRGNLDAAEAYHQKSLALNEELGRKEGMANQYGNLGLIEETRGNLDAAESYHQKSLAIEEELGRKEGMASDYGNLGLIEQTRGNLDAAEAYLKKSLALNEELGRKEGMAMQYGNLGLIKQTRGNLDAAEAYHKKSLAIEEELGRKEGMASDYGNLGAVEELRGNLNGALDYWRRSLALFQEIGMPHMIEKVQGLIDEAEAQKE